MSTEIICKKHYFVGIIHHIYKQLDVKIHRKINTNIIYQSGNRFCFGFGRIDKEKSGTRVHDGARMGQDSSETIKQSLSCKIHVHTFISLQGKYE